MAKFDKQISCKDCEHRCSMFNALSDDEFSHLHRSRVELKFKAGQNIFKQGSAATHVVSFTDGLAKMYIEGYNNRNIIIKLIKPIEIISSPGIFFDNRHHFSLDTLGDSHVCLIDASFFKQMTRESPDFAERIMRGISFGTVYTFERLTDLLQKQMPGRIADALIYLSEKIFGSTNFDMIISRQDLADFTSMSKESACRILKDFKEENIIKTKGNYLQILDMPTLKHISKNG